jgi:predicted dehydrogenase
VYNCALVAALRWGLVGTGDIARRRVAAALRDAPGGELHAVASGRPERARSFAAEHAIPRVFDDWRDLVCDPEVDAVYVATPVRWHAEPAIAAAAAGKHVLCEKPMAMDVAEAEAMVDAARRHGVRLGVAYYRHHYPLVARLRSLVSSGALGRPVFVQAQAFERFDPRPGDPRAWLLRRSESGGGPMMDFGCHRLEVFLDLMGPVAEARGLSTNVLFRDRDVEDACVAHLRFASGALGVLAVAHAARQSRDLLEVVGTEGSAHVPVLNEGRLRLTTAAGTSEEHHPAPANLHQPLVEDFVSAVREGRSPAVSGEVGLAVSRVLAAIFGAAE